MPPRVYPSAVPEKRGRLPNEMIGASPRRKEDRRLLVGGGRFVDDLTREGLLHLAVVRSVQAHARIAKIALAEARALPGVVAAWSAADLPETARPMPSAYGAVRKGRPWSQPILARDRVRYVGEPVAVRSEERRVGKEGRSRWSPYH